MVSEASDCSLAEQAWLQEVAEIEASIGNPDDVWKKALDAFHAGKLKECHEACHGLIWLTCEAYKPPRITGIRQLDTFLVEHACNYLLRLPTPKEG